jgi:thioester reductase-like protein
MKLLLTGATGFLGGELALKLLDQVEIMYLLARPASRERAKSILLDHPKVRWVDGDLRDPQCIKNTDLLDEIYLNVDTIVHAAALYDLYGQRKNNFLANVVGTQNVLYLAGHCQKLKTFHLVSSIAVAGDLSRTMQENELDCGQQFNNPYGETKFESEFHVRRAKFDANIRIYRPGVVIGNSQTGHIPKHDGPYYFFNFLNNLSQKRELLRHLKYLPLPYDPEALLPLIPIDHLVDCIAEGVMEPGDQKLACYHLFSPDSPSIQEFVEGSFKAYGLDSLKVFPLKRDFRKLISLSGMLEKLGMPSQLLDYMYADARFDQTTTLARFSLLKNSQYSQYAPVFYSCHKGQG